MTPVLLSLLLLLAVVLFEWKVGWLKFGEDKPECGKSEAPIAPPHDHGKYLREMDQTLGCYLSRDQREEFAEEIHVIMDQWQRAKGYLDGGWSPEGWSSTRRKNPEAD